MSYGKRVSGPEDIVRFPFTTHMEVEEYSRNCIQFLRQFGGCYIQRTSGTTQNPKMVGWSFSEFEEETRVITKYWKTLGITNTSDRFIVSLGAPGIAHQIVLHSMINTNCTVLPLPLWPKSDALWSHVVEIARFRPSAIVSAPTMMIRYKEVADEQRVNLEKVNLRKIVLTGEPLSKSIRSKIADLWSIDEKNIFDAYCTTEASTIGYELPGREGLYISKNKYIAEIISPDNDKPTNGYGEVVLTKIDRFSFPHLRLRTGDIGTMVAEEKIEDENFYVMAGIKGRLHDSIRLHLCTIYRKDIEAVIWAVDRSARNYLVHVYDDSGKQRILVKVDGEKSLQKCEEISRQLLKLNPDFQALVEAGVIWRPSVTYVQKGSIPRTGKESRIVYTLPK